jgi:hypothetical protein
MAGMYRASSGDTVPLPRGYGSPEAPFGYDEKGYRYAFDPVAAGRNQQAYDDAQEAQRVAERRAQGLLGARNEAEQAYIDDMARRVAEEERTRQAAGTQHTYYFENGELLGDTMQEPGKAVVSGPVKGTPAAGTFGGATIPAAPLAPPPALISPIVSAPLARNMVDNGGATMLNVNRPVDDSGGQYLVNGRMVDKNGTPIPSGPQILPTNATVAEAPKDWTLIILVVLALIGGVMYMRKHRK